MSENEKVTYMTVAEMLTNIFERLEKIERVLTELQDYLKNQNMLPDIYYSDALRRE